jgi:hypothetical protein
VNGPGYGAHSGLGAVATGLAWSYLSAVFVAYEPGLPFDFDAAWWLASCFVVVVITFLALWHMLKRGLVFATSVDNYSILAITCVASVVAADIAHAVYTQPSISAADAETEARMTDSQVWVSELYPQLYYPTERGFRLHKPNTSARGTLFGNSYRTAMRDSPTLMQSVLEAQDTEISIDDGGFRDSGSLRDATVLALGDSMTFGWGVNESECWVDLLEKASQESVFNLGIRDASPLQEVQLLEHVLRTSGRPPQLTRVLWMIYEGNDLEDSYEEGRPENPATLRARAAGTLLELLIMLPETLKNEAIITKLRTGRITLRTAESDRSRRYSVDGVELQFPLYHSPTLGYKLFYGDYVARVQEDETYVHSHDNRPKLERVFARMAALAEEFDFEVVVLLTPSADRLHGPFFEGFPQTSARPYFLDLVADLSARQGFQTVDLLTLMKPYADKELLYFRDDDHLNERGNQVVADLIREAVFPN